MSSLGAAKKFFRQQQPLSLPLVVVAWERLARKVLRASERKEMLGFAKAARCPVRTAEKQ
jgi:DTW domain-containing protein YfiP